MEVVSVKLAKMLTAAYPGCTYCLARVQFIEFEPYIADQLIEAAHLIEHLLKDHRLTDHEIFEMTGNLVALPKKRKW